MSLAIYPVQPDDAPSYAPKWVDEATNGQT